MRISHECHHIVNPVFFGHQVWEYDFMSDRQVVYVMVGAERPKAFGHAR